MLCKREKLGSGYNSATVKVRKHFVYVQTNVYLFCFSEMFKSILFLNCLQNLIYFQLIPFIKTKLKYNTMLVLTTKKSIHLTLFKLVLQIIIALGFNLSVESNLSFSYTKIKIHD